MRAPRKLSVALTATVAASTGIAFSQISPVAQDRSVDTSATATLPAASQSDTDSDAAVGFGPFVASGNAFADVISGGTEVISQGTAIQNSNHGANFVAASGEASVTMTLLSTISGSALAEGASLFEFEFTISSLSTFALDGAVDTQSIVTGGASVPILATDLVFEDVSNGIILFEALTNDESFSLGGMLNPGTYQFIASATVDASEVSSVNATRTVAGSSSFEFLLGISTVPIPESTTLLGALGVGALCGVTWFRRRQLAA